MRLASSRLLYYVKVYTLSIFFGDVLLERDKCHTISQSSQADKLVTPPRISIFIVFDCTTDIKPAKHVFFCSLRHTRRGLQKQILMKCASKLKDIMHLVKFLIPIKYFASNLHTNEINQIIEKNHH